MSDELHKHLRELSLAAEKVLQQDHPNPDRIGCPKNSVLEEVANFAGGSPSYDYDVLCHIFDECYPCYREVKTLRARSRQQSHHS